MPRKYKAKTIVGHIFQYEYFIEKMGKIAIVIIFIVSAIVLGDWTDSLHLYFLFPSTIGFYALGLSLLVTVLVALTAAVSLLMPHIEPSFRPKGFRRARDERTLLMILLVVIVILLIASTTVFLLSVTKAMAGLA